MPSPTDHIDTVVSLKTRGEPFAVATVVRTVSMTAAKAGAKAVIRRDGTHFGGLDRRRLRARGGAESGARGPRRRQSAPRLGAAEGSARPERRRCRRGARRHPLREEHVPEPGHDGRLRRARAAAPAARRLRVEPRRGGARRAAPRFGFSVAVAAPAAEQAAFADVETRSKATICRSGRRGAASSSSPRRATATAPRSRRRSPSKPTMSASSPAAEKWR